MDILILINKLKNISININFHKKLNKNKNCHQLNKYKIIGHLMRE